MKHILKTSKPSTPLQEYRCSEKCTCSELKYPLNYQVFETERSNMELYKGRAQQEITLAEINRKSSSSKDFNLKGIRSKNLARIYMLIVNNQQSLVALDQTTSIMKEISSLNLNERLVLQVISWRIIFGYSQQLEAYDPKKMAAIIYSRTVNGKWVQNYRKTVLDAYQRYALDKIECLYVGTIKGHLFKKRQNFLQKYFAEELKTNSKERETYMMKHFFFYDSKTQTRCANYAIRRLGNISYLSYFIPKSVEFQKDLHKFCRKEFLKRKMINYENKIERAISIVSRVHNT